MSIPIDLKQLEQKAWRSTFDDGLWDIYYGLIVICIGFFIYRPAGGYSPVNIVLMLAAMTGSYGLFWAGKRWITLPRMGQVKFGPVRQKRKYTLAILLGIVVAVQIVFVTVQIVSWEYPEFGARIFGYLNEYDMETLVVAVVGALFVLPGMLLIAYFQDFPRGFYISAMMSLAVFLMIWLNRPIYALIVGSLIVLPGIVLLVRFIKKYPAIPRDEEV